MTIPQRGRDVLVVIAVVVIALLGYSLARSHDRESHPAATTPAAPSAPVPEAVEWRDVGGIRVPASRQYGPRCLDETHASCFQHSDTGAGFAAANLLVRTFAFAGSDVFGPTIARQVVGPEQPEMARLTADAYRRAAKAAGVKDGSPLPTDGGQVTGYRIITPYGGEQDGARNVGVLVSQARPDLGSPFVEYVVHVSWDGNDWLMTTPPWGDWQLAAHPVGDPQSQDWRPFDEAAGR